ncbi:hypothetical protein [Yersinia mollaretii]|uniref:Uncharacterized protein n=1 Tax=Yersinia mollaretii TaxID=33060 RepID=A0AA36LN27_YERMO|nr:hypothetical protein [Yersinia mollaretii]CNH90495.1 Uncharacterised protein [Yersinia mollaretii]
MTLIAIFKSNSIENHPKRVTDLPVHKHASVVENLPKSNNKIGKNLVKICNSIVKLDRKKINQQTLGERLSELKMKIKTILQTEKKPLEFQRRPLPSRIASHALINQYTPKIGRVADYICNKILNSHEMRKINNLISNCDKAEKNKVDKIINDCNKALNKADIGFLEMRNLYGDQFAIAFKEEFGHALATGSHLLDIQKTDGHQSIEPISDSQRLIDLIQDNQKKYGNNLEMGLEIKLKKTIPSPFRKEGDNPTPEQKANDEAEITKINTKNYGNTEFTQESHSPAYRKLPEEYKYKAENKQEAVIPERILKSEPKYQKIMVEVNNKKIEEEFKEARKDTITTSIKSYKFLQENAPTIFKLEDSLQ